MDLGSGAGGVGALRALLAPLEQGSAAQLAGLPATDTIAILADVLVSALPALLLGSFITPFLPLMIAVAISSVLRTAFGGPCRPGMRLALPKVTLALRQ